MPAGPARPTVAMGDRSNGAKTSMSCPSASAPGTSKGKCSAMTVYFRQKCPDFNAGSDAGGDCWPVTAKHQGTAYAMTASVPPHPEGGYRGHRVDSSRNGGYPPKASFKLRNVARASAAAGPRGLATRRGGGRFVRAALPTRGGGPHCRPRRRGADWPALRYFHTRHDGMPGNPQHRPIPCRRSRAGPPARPRGKMPPACHGYVVP